MGRLFITLLRRDLLRNKGPFIALAVMVILGVASFTAIYGGYSNLRDEIENTYEELRFHDVLIEVTPRGADSFDPLGTVAGVTEWHSRLASSAPVLFEGDRPPVMATVISLPMEAGAIDQLRYRDGRPPGMGERGVVAEAGFADHHGLRPGDELEIWTPSGSENLTITGIAISPEYLWPAKTVQEHMPDVLRRWGVIWVGQDLLDAALGRPGLANQAVLRIEESADLASVLDEARSALGVEALRVETRERQASNVVLGLMVNALNQIAFVLPLLFLGIVGVSTYVVLMRLVGRQRSNIGLLRALGYRPADILAHYLSYAPVVALAGTAIGFAVGHAVSLYVTDVFSNYVSLVNVPVPIRWNLLAVAFSVSLLFAGAASVLPAMKAARLRPAEAMRPPVPPAGRRSPLERLLGHLKLPHGVRLALRNVGRNPRRAVLTIIGVGLAVSTLVIPQIVINSLDRVVDVAVVRVQQADSILVLKQPVAIDALAAAAAALDGVRLELMIQLQASFRFGGTERDISIVGLVPQGELMVLFARGDEEIHPSGDGIILSRVFERSGLAAGDTIELFGEPVPVLAFTQASGTTGFVPLSTAQRWAGMPGRANLALVKHAQPDDTAENIERLSALLPVAAAQNVQQSIQDTRDMLRLYYGMVYLILAFGVVIGAAIIFNTVAISVLEEIRDYATLRILGTPAGSLAAQATTETLALTVPGSLLGLGLGTLLARYFVEVFNSDLFVLDMYVSPVAYLTAFAAGLLISLLAQLPSLRQIFRLDLAKDSRERAV